MKIAAAGAAIWLPGMARSDASIALASGKYLRLTAGDAVRTRKLLLLR